jgi:hypothetical protein
VKESGKPVKEHGMFDGWDNDYYDEYYGSSGDCDPNEFFMDQDLICTEDDLVEAGSASFYEIDNRNRLTELTFELEKAQNEGASSERFKQLRSNFVFAGSMLIRAWEQGLSEHIVIEIGMDINRCKRVCEKKMAESVNF